MYYYISSKLYDIIQYIAIYIAITPRPPVLRIIGLARLQKRI